MHKENHHSPVALSYAQALLDLANESRSASAIGQELSDLRQVIDATATFAGVLADPAVGVERREKLIHTVFEGRLSKLLVNFLLVANERGRLGLLAEFAGAYDELLDQQQGTVEVDVTVAQHLDGRQLETVRRQVSAALKRDAAVQEYVDPEMIGGLILRVQDQLIDGSVRAQLAAMRRQLLEAKPT